MKKKRRQFFAIFLALCLMLGLLPASALAESADTAAAANETAAASDDDSSGDSDDKDYIGDSSYYYESTSFTDDDVSDYDADDSSDYSWSASATSDYYTMSGYYYAVTNSSDGTTYYQVYYKVTTSSSTDDDGNTTTTVASVTLYYTTDGSTYTSIGTVSDSTGISLYKAYIDSELDYDALYAAINGTLSESSSSDITDLTILRGYYYLYSDTLYYVYYVYTAPTNTTDAYIMLYYSSSASATSTSDCTQLATLTSGGTTTVTLYTEFELNISAYENTAQVFWDLDDSSGEYNNYDGDDGDSSYITSVTMTNTNNNTAQTVTFGESTDTSTFEAGTSNDNYEWGTPTGGLTLSSVYVDSNGAAVSDAAYASKESTLSITPAEGYYVSRVIIVCAPYAGKSTDSDNDDDDDDDGSGDGDDGETPDIPDGGGDGNGGETPDIPDGGGGNTGGGGTFSLAAASDESEAAAASEDDLVTAAENTGRLSPYQCSTYVTGQSYEGTFTLSDSTASSSGYTLTIDLSNEYFAHSGALASEETQVYFILIEVAAVPTPAYVEYDYGDIVSYISAYNTANKLTSSTDEGYVDSDIFTSNANGWTDTYTVSTTDDNGNTTTSDGNVYSDNQYSSSNTSGTQGGIMNGGVLTDDTQYEYVYDTSGTIKTSNWKHCANSITNDAIEAAAAAGYVFAGWAVTWYANASVATGTDGTYARTTSNYNYYTITFSDALYTSLRTEGAEVPIVGHVRLVAQWVKADDITQVIDYGLPVSTNVAEENEDDLALKAIKSSVSSRTSSETDYGSATTVELSTKITNVQYSVTTTTTSTDEDRDETSSTSTNYETTAAGTYGDFSLDSTDTDGGTAIYTLNTQMTGIESVKYQVTLSYVTGSGSSATTTELCNPTGTITIVPATSMYYEEDFGVAFEDYTVTTSEGDEDETTSSTTTTYQTVKSQGLITYSMGAVYWIQEGTSSNYTQETGIVGTEDDSTYGADKSYLSNLGDSNGTSMYANVAGNYDATFSYSFTGTGTAIYARTSNNSAYIGVVVKDSSDNVVDTKYIDTRVVEDSSTYSSGSDGTTLYNIPVYELTDQDWGTYTVTVTVYDDDTPVNGWYTTSTTTDEDGNTSTTETLVGGSDESGDEFYLDGIRIYDPLGTGEATTSTDDGSDSTDDTPTETGTAAADENDSSSGGDTTDDTTEDSSTANATNCGDDYVIALAAYEGDVEAYHTEINISDKLEKDIEGKYLSNSTNSEGDSSGEDSTESTNSDSGSTNDTSSDAFVTITDVDGNITSYSNYFDIGPDNELYLYGSSSSSDDVDAADDSETEESTTYKVTFYLLNWNAEEYDVYLGLKAPLGTSSSVEISGTTVTISGSADCYYQLDDYISTSTEAVTLTSDDSSAETTATKVTITGVSGLTALTWLKITGTSETTSVAYESDITVENEDDNGGTTETLVIEENTVYLVSATTYASLTASADEEDADGDMLDDDAMGVDPDDSEDEEDSAEPETGEDEEDESSVFEPETFDASISYLKLLRYASITVKASSDVSYITVNGTVVTGRTFMNKNTKTFSYTASRVSSGTTFEIIAYNSDGTASGPITLTAK